MRGPGLARSTALTDLLAATRPWRRRLASLAVVWLVVVVGSQVFGLSPSVPIFFVMIASIFSVAWFVLDHTAANHLTVWPLVDGHLGSGSRGNDFRVTSLATRLEAANARSEGREALVRDLHLQLSTIIRERLFAKHGLVIEEEPRWSEGVMPPELWDFIVTLPPPDLYRPAKLDGILQRIETW
ncbi:MAG: hypothetical protein L0H96_18830 [Humibacillus sp.]|nr:hypothetical protein [Humibacillus sp.]MDN5778953.1 hypothetical protein [Humibacillus sp.]